MDKGKIEIVKGLAKDYNQYDKSLLQSAIKQVTGCNDSQAAEWGHSHCNLLSWYFGLFAEQKIMMPYAMYFESLLKNKCCNEAGNMLLTKDNIAPLCFGFEYPVDYLYDFDNVLNPSNLDPESFYQLRIINSSHYMCSWVENSKLMIADTHDRGYGVPAIGAARIDKEHFSWMMKI